MKRLFFLLCVCLLLSGCVEPAVAQNSPAATTSATLPAQTQLDTPTQANEETFQTLSSQAPDGYYLCCFRKGLLLFSGSESTTLTLLQGEDLSVSASISLEFFLSADDPSIRIWENALSYFDPVQQKTVVLDAVLQEVASIAAPDGLVGSPVLSSDRNVLYYCTANALRAWDLRTGIRRLIRGFSYPTQTVSGLHLHDTVVQCSVQEGTQTRTLLISVKDGRLAAEHDGPVSLTTQGNHYYASFLSGTVQALVFGDTSQSPQMLMPDESFTQWYFLPSLHGVVTGQEAADGKTELSYFDLSTGEKAASLSLECNNRLVSAAGDSQQVYLLLYDELNPCTAICRWDIAGQTAEEQTYISTYSADSVALAQCQQTAREMSEKYGIEILIGPEAAAVQPWDYNLEAETLVPILQQELNLLDQRLGQYPQEILSATVSDFSSLKLCIVRSLTGTAESGSLDSANGLHFDNDGDAYVVLAAGKYTEQALYHELFHVMETYILKHSTAFDQWETLNPAGFSYDCDFEENEQRDPETYLTGEDRAFVDTYSMSFPAEDRARIMEYAMLPDGEELFQSRTMQAKLLSVCKGIREAYGLESEDTVFPWEQYLNTTFQ